MNDDGTAILFQNGIYGLGKMEELVEESIELGITDAADAVCDFEIIEEGKDFRCLVNYSADIFEYDSIDKLFKTFCKAAKFLIEYGPKPNAPIDELIRTLSE